MTEQNSNKTLKKVLIMAGGTGGHVFPALAVADELRRRDVDVSWLGTRKGIEAELVPENGYPIDYIQVEGLRGTGILRWLRAPFVLLRAVWQARRVIKRLQPDVLLGLGGFASGPGGVAGRLLRKPLVIHEQNALPGTTNKLLAKFAARVMVAFPNAFADGEWCGNPVRNEISHLPAPSQDIVVSERPLRLLVLGGSLGALAINKAIPAALALLEDRDQIQVRHQCGRKHEEATIEAYREAGVTASVEPFIADMAEAYSWADLVVCRAGALTVSELAAAGVGSILVPYPYAIDDHQTANANWLVAARGAELLPEAELTAEALARKLKHWLRDRASLRAMAVNARRMAKTDSAALVANACEEVCSDRK